MTIQFLGIRSFIPKGETEEKTYDAFFKEGWTAPSVIDIIKSPEKYVQQIPEKQRWNMFYTVANCGEEKREFKDQRVIVFDLDQTDYEKTDEYISIVSTIVGLPKEDLGVLKSGNGLHIIIALKNRIQTPAFFKTHRIQYKTICKNIEKACKNQGLALKEVDPTVFDARRILRLPLTVNRKVDKEDTQCTVYQDSIRPVDFDLIKVSGVPLVTKKEQINSELIKKYPKTDNEEIFKSCGFLKWAKEKPNDLTEPQWYAALSITARLENGHEISHDISKGHRSYTLEETNDKIEQAIESSGPRTCSSISNIFNGCTSCPLREKVSSPILIKGENHIGTEHTGFHSFKQNKDGSFKLVPNYDDLVKFFYRTHPYISLGDSRMCLVWNGTHYEHRSNVRIEEFAQIHFDPSADDKMRTEFRKRICCTNIKTDEWFSNTTSKKMNFQNGVLDIKSGAFEAHSEKRGFRYVLPYEYQPEAECPTFFKMMDRITGGDGQIVSILGEFMGYALSNDPCWTQKALVLVGEGANGKSTFMNCLSALAGDNSYSSLNMMEISKSEYSRQLLDGKLFNISEETPTNSLLEGSHFKNLVTGGRLQVRQPYKDPYSIQNRAKLIFSCNELPQSKDASYGFFRRLILVPFEQVFTKDNSDFDPYIEEKLMAELPGIFNFALEGYRRLWKQRGFTESLRVDALNTEYRLQVDTVQSWAREYVTVYENGGVEAHQTPLMELYSCYKAKMDVMNIQPITYIEFARRMRKIVPQSKERFVRTRETGRRGIMVQGVSVNE